MFAIMATTAIFFPMVGDTTRINVVWIYPQLLFGGEAAGTPLHTHSLPSGENGPPRVTANDGAVAGQPSVRERDHIEKTATAGDHRREPLPDSSPDLEEKISPSPTRSEPLSPEPVPEEKTVLPAETVSGQPAAAGNDQRAKVAAGKLSLPAVTDLPAGNQMRAVSNAPTDKTGIPNGAGTASVPGAKPPASPAPPSLSGPEPPPIEKLRAPVRETAAKTAVSLPMPPVASRRALSVPGVADGGEKNRAEQPLEPSRRSDTPVAGRTAGKLPTQSTGPQGIFAPPPIGDLKIVIKGSDEALKTVRISALFREYPRARHNRPMSKAHAGNVRVLTPKMARVAKNILQAVIVSAEDGVYDFRSLSDSGNRAEAAFSVTIYENSGRAKTKSEGTRKIGATGSIAKVLMPEGILWDDDSAFSGSYEDSESITRFNADTGLVWKEYKE